MYKKIAPHLIVGILTFLPAAAHAQLQNPLGVTDIRVLIGRVIRALLGISGAVALLMFVYGGMLWLTSGGNADQIKKGKNTLIWAVIGLVVIFTSYTLVSALISAITTGELQ